MIDHRAASALQPTTDGTVDLEIHVKSMRLGGSHPTPVDQWYVIDKMVNFAPVGSSTEPVTGGHCRNVEKGSYTYEQNQIEKTGSFDVCMDACHIFDGTVVNKEYKMPGFSSTTPTCQLTETTCQAPWWHADTGICDLGCSQSGGILEPENAKDPNGKKTCSWNDTTDICTYEFAPSWSQNKLCDNFCQTNSGTLTKEGACVYSNMTY